MALGLCFSPRVSTELCFRPVAPDRGDRLTPFAVFSVPNPKCPAQPPNPGSQKGCGLSTACPSLFKGIVLHPRTVNPSRWKGCVWGQAGLLLLHALFFNTVSVDLYLSAVVTCQKTLRTTDLNRSNWILPRNKQQENKYFFVSHCRDDHYRYITTTWCVVSPALEEQGAAFGVACSLFRVCAQAIAPILNHAWALHSGANLVWVVSAPCCRRPSEQGAPEEHHFHSLPESFRWIKWHRKAP